jgi:hypothetical protein
MFSNPFSKNPFKYFRKRIKNVFSGKSLCRYSHHQLSRNCGFCDYGDMHLKFTKITLPRWSLYLPLKQLIVLHHVAILPVGFEVLTNQVTDLLTNFMGWSPFSESNSSELVKRFAFILWNLKVYYRADLSLPLVPVLSQANPFHVPPSAYSVKFILMLSSYVRLGLPRDLFPSGLLTANVYGFLFAPACHMHYPSYLPPFDHSNNIPRGVQIMKPSLIRFSLSFLQLPSRFRYLPQHPVLEHPHAYDGPSCTTIQQKQNYGFRNYDSYVFRQQTGGQKILE